MKLRTMILRSRCPYPLCGHHNLARHNLSDVKERIKLRIAQSSWGVSSNLQHLLAGVDTVVEVGRVQDEITDGSRFDLKHLI